jgi:hypothetical protein
VTIVEFLRARLKEDADYARNAFGDHNEAGPDWYEQWSGSLNIGEHEDLVNTNDSQVSRFMERFDPARVLREVEAKRRMIPHLVVDGHDLDHCDRCMVARLLAESYDDHPEFDESWRP